MGGSFSELYYALIFLILAAFQDEIKGTVGSLLCFSMILVSDALIKHMSIYGVTFFEAAALYDFLIFISGLFLINSRSGKILILVSVLSFIFNLISWQNYSEYRVFIKEYYGLVNIILFEILVYGHFTTTKIYPVIKEKSIRFEKRLESKIKNFNKGCVK